MNSQLNEKLEPKEPEEVNSLEPNCLNQDQLTQQAEYIVNPRRWKPYSNRFKRRNDSVTFLKTTIKVLNSRNNKFIEICVMKKKCMNSTKTINF